jgi:hypothetical protein
VSPLPNQNAIHVLTSLFYFNFAAVKLRFASAAAASPKKFFYNPKIFGKTPLGGLSSAGGFFYMRVPLEPQNSNEAASFTRLRNLTRPRISIEKIYFRRKY